MKHMCRGCRVRCPPLLSIAFCAMTALPVWAQSATRDLPDYYIPGVTLTVSIAIDAPPGSGAVALQDAPPVGWVVSSVTNGGEWDGSTEQVKWGPFFEPSIPASVSYDLTSPSGPGAGQIGGPACFDGLISFVSTGDLPIGGELCIPFPVPALSGWGIIALAATLLTAASIVLSRRKATQLV